MKIKIYYHHTDCGGVVYYANYLNFLEEARTEFMAEKGVMVWDLVKKGTLFVVARQEIDYKYPAVYGDILDIDTRITDISGVRVNFEYEIKNQDKRLLTKAKTILVCVDKSLKPQAIPEDIKERLAK